MHSTDAGKPKVSFFPCWPIKATILSNELQCVVCITDFFVKKVTISNLHAFFDVCFSNGDGVCNIKMIFQ